MSDGTYYVVSKEIEFDAGHRVPNHKSKCRNPHGHRYKLRCHVRGPLVADVGASDEGMVADFGDIKTLMTELVHDVFDHGFIVYEDDDRMLDALTGDVDWNIQVVSFVPTAENLAAHIFHRLAKPIAELNGGLELFMVQLYETPTSIATYPG